MNKARLTLYYRHGSFISLTRGPTKMRSHFCIFIDLAPQARVYFFGRFAFFLVSGGGLWRGSHGLSGAKRRKIFWGVFLRISQENQAFHASWSIFSRISAMAFRVCPCIFLISGAGCIFYDVHFFDLRQENAHFCWRPAPREMHKRSAREARRENPRGIPMVFQGDH